MKIRDVRAQMNGPPDRGDRHLRSAHRPVGVAEIADRLRLAAFRRAFQMPHRFRQAPLLPQQNREVVVSPPGFGPVSGATAGTRR